MDINKVARKIADEENTDMSTAEQMANRFNALHPDIKAVADAWLNGTLLPFEFMGISLDAIQKRDKCGFASAILTMSFLLKKPKYTEDFLKYKMTVEDSEG